MKALKKLFGGIDLTYKKVIIFALIASVYTALMAIIPITQDTSFRDISVTFEWWILFGVIIIANSKSPKDSALKCFLFFLISQPLIYLFQVPFCGIGWQIFKFYKFWFIWTLLTIPMGFIGYYIKKDNILSAIILLPMTILLALLGMGFFTSCISSFPHHLLSCIACCVFIIMITFGVLSKKLHRLLVIGITILFAVGYIFLKDGITSSTYETYRSLNNYPITLSGDVEVTSFSGEKKGKVVIMHQEEGYYSAKIRGKQNEKYTFTIKDEKKKEYKFEYYYDKEQKTVILKLIK